MFLFLLITFNVWWVYAREQGYPQVRIASSRAVSQGKTAHTTLPVRLWQIHAGSPTPPGSATPAWVDRLLFCISRKEKMQYRSGNKFCCLKRHMLLSRGWLPMIHWGRPITRGAETPACFHTQRGLWAEILGKEKPRRENYTSENSNTNYWQVLWQVLWRKEVLEKQSRATRTIASLAVQELSCRSTWKVS